MHIVLAIIGSLVTILILLSRLADAGIDLGGLNPFLWNRRRKWRKKHDGNPLFKIDNPLDATAILMVATVKADGDMTKEDKSLLLNLFETELKLSRKDAAGLMVSSVHLLGDGKALRQNVKKFLAASKTGFSDSQISSATMLIEKVAGEPNSRHETTHALTKEIIQIITPKNDDSSKTW